MAEVTVLKNWLTLSFFAVLAAAQPTSFRTTIVKTTTMIDGKGHVLKNKEIVIENGRIMRIADAKQKPTIDLSGLTVTPGGSIRTSTLPGISIRRAVTKRAGGTRSPHRSRRRSMRRRISMR